MLPQVFQVATGMCGRVLTSAQLAQDLYPMMLLAPNGQVFSAGSTATIRPAFPADYCAVKSMSALLVETLGALPEELGQVSELLGDAGYFSEANARRVSTP
jgi:hypothetical protein